MDDLCITNESKLLQVQWKILRTSFIELLNIEKCAEGSSEGAGLTLRTGATPQLGYNEAPAYPWIPLYVKRLFRKRAEEPICFQLKERGSWKPHSYSTAN